MLAALTSRFQGVKNNRVVPKIWSELRTGSLSTKQGSLRRVARCQRRAFASSSLRLILSTASSYIFQAVWLHSFSLSKLSTGFRQIGHVLPLRCCRSSCAAHSLHRQKCRQGSTVVSFGRSKHITHSPPSVLPEFVFSNPYISCNMYETPSTHSFCLIT